KLHRPKAVEGAVGKPEVRRVVGEQLKDRYPPGDPVEGFLVRNGPCRGKFGNDSPELPMPVLEPRVPGERGVQPEECRFALEVRDQGFTTCLRLGFGEVVAWVEPWIQHEDEHPGRVEGAEGGDRD